MAGPVPLHELIREDIRRRGLRPGDPYITTREVGSLFGVSAATANRALNELARDGLLVRRQGSGTVVAENGEVATGADTTLHVVCSGGYAALPKVLFDELLRGLQRGFPHAATHITFLPPHDEIRFLESWYGALDRDARQHGAVLLLSPPQVQRFFSETDLPTVLAGSPSPGTNGLPWVDMDHLQGGHLLADHLFNQGHRRIAILMRDAWGAGDNLFLEGIHRAQAEHGLSGGSAALRSVAPDPAVIVQTVRDLLATGDRPTALVCRTDLIASCVARTLEQDGIPGAEDVELAEADGFTHAVAGPALRGALTREAQAELTGQILRGLADGGTPDPDHALIPMHLVMNPTEAFAGTVPD